MSDVQLGFFHRCLNFSWNNDGLPSDSKRLCAVMNVSPQYLDEVFVCECWFEDAGRLRNRRQEAERSYAINKSVRNTKAVQTRYERSTNVATNDAQRAYDSDSVSDSIKEIPFVPIPKKEIRLANESNRFHEFWDKYPMKTQMDLAAGIWCSTVTTMNEPEVFACLDRYLKSEHVGRGVVMKASNWLHDCSRDGWRSDWPLNGNGAKKSNYIDT